MLSFNNFHELIHAIKHLARVHRLNRLQVVRLATDIIYESISYLEDYRRGCPEYWQLPEETISLRSGDCEDTSILLVAVLNALGLESYMPIGYLYQNSNKFGHAWVAVKINNRCYTIETTSGEIYNGKPAHYVYTQLISVEDIENMIAEKRICQQNLPAYMVY